MQKRATQKKGKRPVKKKKPAPIEKKPRPPPQPVKAPVKVVKQAKVRKSTLRKRYISKTIAIAIFSVTNVLYFLAFIVWPLLPVTCNHVPDPESPLANGIDKFAVAMVNFMRAKSFKLGPFMVSCAMFIFLLQVCDDADAAGGYSLLFWLDDCFAKEFSTTPSMACYTVLEIATITCLYMTMRTPTFTMQWKVLVSMASCCASGALMINVNGILMLCMLFCVILLMPL